MRADAPFYDRTKEHLQNRIRVYRYNLDHQNPSEQAKREVEAKLAKCQKYLAELKVA